MTGLALLLVVCSALLHATWNFLYKRAIDKRAFAWLFGLAAAVLYLPAFLLLACDRPIPIEGWGAIAASALVHTFYFTCLGKGYSAGDLSLVYPLSRATVPLLVALWAVVFLGEHLSVQGAAGIVAVVAGVYILHVGELSLAGFLKPLRSIKTRPTQFALTTGLLISIYTVVDKIGVSYVQPLVYMYLWTVLFTLIYGLYVFRTAGWISIKSEWHAHPIAIVVVGLLMVLAYTIVLFAMTMSNVSYVAAAREISVVFGAAMGSLLLREPYGRTKVGGSALIAFGLAMIGLAQI